MLFFMNNNWTVFYDKITATIHVMQYRIINTFYLSLTVTAWSGIEAWLKGTNSQRLTDAWVTYHYTNVQYLVFLLHFLIFTSQFMKYVPYKLFYNFLTIWPYDTLNKELSLAPKINVFETCLFSFVTLASSCKSSDNINFWFRLFIKGT